MIYELNSLYFISDYYKGSSDYLSVKLPAGGREHRQKRILKKNLDDLYKDFQQIYPGVKIGPSSFKYLRYLRCSFLNI